MKRLVSLLLAVAVFACFAACTKGEEQRQEAPPEQTEKEQEKEEPDSPQKSPDEPITEADFDTEAILEGLKQVHAASMRVLERMEPPEPNNNYIPSQEDYQAMAAEIGALGVPVAGFHINMPNYEQVVDFCQSVQEEREDFLILYTLHNTMSVAQAFYTRGGRVANMTGYYDFPLPADKGEAGAPHVESLYPLTDFALTEKGFLIYAQGDGDGEARMHRMYRVLPFDDKLMELTKKYTLSFDRHFSNLMDCNWDSENLDDLHMLELFVTFYGIDHEVGTSILQAIGAGPYGDPTAFGEDKYHYALPALLVEETLQKHLPVTTEYLRSLPEYDASLQVYDFEMTPRGGVPPTPEVVDYEENEDGSLTLYIDAVGYGTGDDRIWTVVLTVRDNPDGSVYYLSCATTFFEVYPYAYLQGEPVVTDAQALAQMEDENYRRFSQIVGPYVTGQPQYDWEYPGDGQDVESRMRYTLALLQNGALESGEEIEEYRNAGTGVYEVPRQELDRHLLDVFDGLTVNDDQLIEQGLLNEERTLYHIPAGEDLFDGEADLNWVDELPDDKLELTVHCYQQDGRYLCQLTFDFEPWLDTPKIHKVEAIWMGDPPTRPQE